MLLINIYTFFSSIVLMRGIGLERLMIFSHYKFDVFYYIKNFVLAFVGTIPAYFFSKIAGRFLPLVPFFLILVLFLLDLLCDQFLQKKSLAPNEKNFTYGISLLALFECYSFFSLVLLLLAGFISLIFYDILLKSINKIIASRNTNYYLRLGSLSLISLGIIVAMISIL